ncbi:hypothetical protein [Streptomyces sp. NPDC048191]|uniref:hypothetical protein n=1 Tax=Streptomyces sp. NPDC048191 TaxID=3155484 RepID=UPI00340BE6F6
MSVTLGGAAGGFPAADAWRDDVDGPGSQPSRAPAHCPWTGRNRYTGGTVLAEGTLVAGSRDALGPGAVRVAGGTPRVAVRLRARSASSCAPEARRR